MSSSKKHLRRLTTPQRTAEPPTVLLVDDDPALLRLMHRLLQGSGLSVLMAPNGLKALALLNEHQGADLVVSDYDMPGMNGIALLDAVERRWPECRRILFTGDADSELVLAARHHRVLTKTMEPNLVRSAIVRAAFRKS